MINPKFAPLVSTPISRYKKRNAHMLRTTRKPSTKLIYRDSYSLLSKISNTRKSVFEVKEVEEAGKARVDKEKNNDDDELI